MIIESYCLNPETGTIYWRSPDFNAYTGIFNTNVYSPEEKMFYTKVNSTIVAWNFADPSKPPTVAWTTYIRGGGITGIGTAYGDGKVFTGSFENMQLALDAKTGRILWCTPTKGPVIFTGVYAEGMYFKGGSDDNTMYAFNASTGEIIWRNRLDTDGYFTTGAAVAYGMVYEMNKDGYLYAFDMYTGEVIWKYKGSNDSLMWPGMPTVADGKIYVTTGEEATYGGPPGISEFSCINALTGQQLWKLDVEALPPRESVAVAYGALYIIPGSVTTAVDTISGNEYATDNHLWAIRDPAPTETTLRVVSSWPQWRADPTHSSSAEVGPSNLSLAWKFQTEGSVISSPSIEDSIAYVGSTDGYLYALDAWNGDLIWKYKTGDLIESSPAVANGKVYTGGDDGYVYCLDAYTSVLQWKTFVNGNLPFTFGTVVLKSSPAVVESMGGTVVYIGSLDGYLYAIDADNGDINWKTKALGPIESSPAYFNGAVYFTAEEPNIGALYKLDAASGEQLWKKEILYEYQFTGGNQMLGSPSVADGKVFAPASLRAYYAFDVASGEQVWQFTEPNAMEFIASSPLYVDGQLFIINKFSITSLDADTGKEIWSSFTGDELYTSLSYADGKLYLMTSQRHIFILDAANNGTKLASFEMPSASWSSPSLANGRLYIGCNDWNVYCFEDNIISTIQTNPTPTQTNNLATPLIAFIIIVVTAAAIAIITLGYTIHKRKK
jgi:outer membrane protein assembly factor BamB